MSVEHYEVEMLVFVLKIKINKNRLVSQEDKIKFIVWELATSTIYCVESTQSTHAFIWIK